MATKVELRTRYRREREERYVPHTFDILLDLPEIKSASKIASYHSYGFEPDTAELNQRLINAGKELYLPRTVGENIEWVRWNGSAESLEKKKNFSEPLGIALSNEDELEVVIVPALRIDRDGYRLGQGGGFYDRALPHLTAWSIALIHPDEISGDALPHDPWDITVHAAATPDVVLRFA